MPRNNRREFDISFSFSADDKWIANDLFRALNERGLDVYFSSDNQDHAGGNLRMELMAVYKNSSINVMLWSHSYMNKPTASIVNFERTLLWDRHVGKSEYKSLFILKLDDAPIPNDFNNCLIHSVKDIGILKAKDFIINRLIDCYRVNESPLEQLSHPSNCVGHRGRMEPCRFRLSSNYKQDGLGRWNLLGDVLVVPLDSNVPQTLKTFLIPSAASPSFLSHPILIKTEPRALSIKQRISIEFVKNYKDVDLNGVLFNIEKNDMTYPHIYCEEYDLFLNRNLT
jgi:hypothetical protein